MAKSKGIVQLPVLDPKTTSKQSKKQVKITDVDGPRPWTYSFKFFRQMENYGVGSENQRWFVSLLDRLTKMCEKTVDEFDTDMNLRNSYRYHDIDWAAKGTKLRKKDLSWVDSEYLTNEAEYKFTQFQLSTGKGRVIGFLDERYVYNIVLLDPKHNAQPSKKHNYQTTPCSPLDNEFEHLDKKVKDLISFSDKRCKVDNCDVKKRLATIHSCPSDFAVLHLKAESFEKACAYVASGEMPSVEDILELGIMTCEENRSQKP